MEGGKLFAVSLEISGAGPRRDGDLKVALGAGLPRVHAP